MSTTSRLQRLFADRFARYDRIDDPVAGLVDPRGFEQLSPVWPALWPRIERVEEVAAGERTAEGYVLYRDDHSDAGVPIGVLWDDASRRARVYYNKSHFGLAEPRRVVTPPEETLALPPHLERYLAAIRSGIPARIAAVVDPAAVIHSMNGTVTGAEFVAGLAALDGGIPIQYCSVTTQGATHACEFISWRPTPHAGLGIYSFDPDGRVIRARLYEGPVPR